MHPLRSHASKKASIMNPTDLMAPGGTFQRGSKGSVNNVRSRDAGGGGSEPRRLGSVVAAALGVGNLG